MTRQTQSRTTGKKDEGGGNAPLAKPLFSLEFLTQTQLQPVHSKKNITAPYLELGRGVSCGIRFDDEDFPMVSRQHAALQAAGGRVLLRHLSATNQTLVNGRPVQQEWELHPGDEIQLSANGPRLRFLDAPAPLMATPVKITQRLKLASEKILKRYRYALIALGVLFVVGAAVAFFFIRDSLANQNRMAAVSASVEQQLAQQRAALAKGDSALVAERARQAEALAEANKKNDEFQARLTEMGGKSDVMNVMPRAPKTGPDPVPAPPPPAPAVPVQASLQAVKNHVYALKLYLSIKDGRGEFLELANEGGKKSLTENILLETTGTGFLLDDGRFITARRWVEPWAYLHDEKDYLTLFANFIRHNGGNASVKIVASRPGGADLVLHSHQFTTDLLHDRVSVGDFGFGEGKIATADPETASDWAVYKGAARQGLPFMNEILESNAPDVPDAYYAGAGMAAGAQATARTTLFFGKSKLLGTTPNGELVSLTTTDMAANAVGGPVMTLIDKAPVVIGVLTMRQNGTPAVIPLHKL